MELSLASTSNKNVPPLQPSSYLRAYASNQPNQDIVIYQLPGRQHKREFILRKSQPIFRQMEIGPKPAELQSSKLYGKKCKWNKVQWP